MRTRLSNKAAKEIENRFRNNEEAHELLKLIDAEFKSDPTSVQCFDLRIVERVSQCVAKREEYLKNCPYMIR